MLAEYIQAAMAELQCEWLPDSEEYYCEIPELRGVWGTGRTETDARDDLRDALEGWLTLGLAMHHHIPVLSGIDVNTLGLDKRVGFGR